MKVLVVSDTHGQHRNLIKVIEEVGMIDMFIHLGDVEGGELFLENLVSCEKHIIKGNNDFFSDLPREEEFYIGAKKVFITHGHNYYVSLNYDMIKDEGRHRGDDIVMFGHTHKPYLEQSEDLLLLNPGSISFPRQAGKLPSYAVLEVSENNKVNCQIFYLKNC